MKQLSFLLSLTLLAQPAAAKKPMDMSVAGTAPVDYDALIKSYLEEKLRDPMSAIVRETRGLRLGVWYPHWDFISKGAGFPYWMACYKINAKNAFGAYVGFIDYAFLFSSGKIEKVAVSNSIDDRPNVARECAKPASATD